jgi:6-hydroxycyclohex-1-ene-1-carbonyl-CoA dehydrogenase
MVLKKKINIESFVQTRPMSTIAAVFEEAHKVSPDKRIVLTPDFK